MNLLESTDEAPSDVFFANFNQDCTALSVGSKNIFWLYSLQKVDELEVFHGIVAADVLIIERHYRSKLVALVTVSSPRILYILHILKEHEINRFSYPNTILAVQLNESRLVVCLEKSLYIQELSSLELMPIIRDTAPNPLGLCIISQNIEKNFLAYPGSSSNGEVQIYDTFNNCSMGMIAAHENPLAAMAFNATATKIATASERGTVIRVFDVIEKTRLYEFRPGVTRYARTYSLCFSQDSNYLSSSSNTETVHIFRLENMREGASAEEPQAFVRNPTNVMDSPTNMLYQDRAFATVRLPFSGIRNICALARIQESLRVLIVSAQRILYIYNVDSVNGGECVLERTYNLSESGCSMPVNKPLRFACVEGLTQHQQGPAYTNPAEKWFRLLQSILRYSLPAQIRREMRL